MNLCIHCGKVGDHAKGCAVAPTSEATPQAKNERALAGLAAAKELVEHAKKLASSSPREAAKAIFAAEGTLEKHPSSDLTSFEHKRNYKALEDQAKKVKQEIEGNLGASEAETLFADLAFTRKGLELLHAVTLRRREVAALRLGTLATLPELAFDPAASADPTEPGSVLKAACEAIERRLSATTSVDGQVDEWGKAYLEPLAAGESPREWPAHVSGAKGMPLGLVGGGALLIAGGAAAALGAGQQPVGAAIGGVGILVLGAGAALFAKASAKKRQAPAVFAALSQAFRERLYLVCVLRSLRAVLSNLSKAEEAMRTHASGGENAARWKRIKTQTKDVVKAIAGDDWDESRGVDDEMAKRIQAAGLVVEEGIRPAGGLSRDDWDGLAKAYQVERREDSTDSDGARLEVLSHVVLERASLREEATAERKKAIAEARAAFAGRGGR